MEAGSCKLPSLPTPCILRKAVGASRPPPPDGRPWMATTRGRKKHPKLMTWELLARAKDEHHEKFPRAVTCSRCHVIPFQSLASVTHVEKTSLSKWCSSRIDHQDATTPRCNKVCRNAVCKVRPDQLPEPYGHAKHQTTKRKYQNTSGTPLINIKSDWVSGKIRCRCGVLY